MQLETKEHIHCKNCEAWGACAFQSFDDSDLENLLRSKSCRFYNKGQIVFEADKKPLGVYCIKTGLVKITANTSDLQSQPILHLAQPGEILGCGATIHGFSYHYNAQTIMDSEICQIEKETFLTFLKENPSFTYEILTRKSHALKERDLHISRIGQGNVRERLAKTLLLLKAAHGEKNKNGVKISIALTREEIAQMTGTVQESVVRILSDFQDEKLIKLKKREIVILDEEGLKDIFNPQKGDFSP